MNNDSEIARVIELFFDKFSHSADHVSLRTELIPVLSEPAKVRSITNLREPSHDGFFR